MRDWRVGGDRGRQGQVGSQRQVKATIQTQRVVLCLQCVTQTDAIDKGGQDWCEEQFGTPYSPINAPQDHEMHPRGFTASVKTSWKSRPGNLLSSAWCFWVVHGCNSGTGKK